MEVVLNDYAIAVVSKYRGFCGFLSRKYVSCFGLFKK